MSDLDLRTISNGRVSSRIRQIFVLLLAIVIGILISISCSAQTQPTATALKSNHTISVLPYSPISL